MVEGQSLLKMDLEQFGEMVNILFRELTLNPMAMYWNNFDLFLAEDKQAELKILLQAFEDSKHLFFLAGKSTWVPKDACTHIPFLRIEFPRPNGEERRILWKRILKERNLQEDAYNLPELANAFRFNGGQIKDVIVTAENLAKRRGSPKVSPTMSEIYMACRLQSNRKLEELAKKIVPHYFWEDIVLPSDSFQQLREVCTYVKNRSLVLDHWGFDQKLSLGKGINVLFSGSSGTGKTMAAEIIANELGLDLYKIDLSTVVSKYIGETEKNLSRIFGEAETSNAILFFDEADALFGRRSEVRDSHDRYANIEVGYLLQKMEEYEGIVILATNLRKNMDEAFVRRMHATIEFPFPNREDRRRIWEGIWPNETPCAKDLDLTLLAERFEMSGGNIRNVALAAAFLASENGHLVSMPHIFHATRREFQKMGKVITESEFGDCGKKGTAQFTWQEGNNG